MKVLLIHPPNTKDVMWAHTLDYDKKARSHLPPLGLLYLVSYLEPQHDVKVIDMRAADLGSEDIVPILGSFEPDLIGIGCVITQWRSVLDVVRTVKQHAPQIPVVVGGPNPTWYPEETLKWKEIDYVISGCGQIPLMRLCSRLENGRRTDDIDYCYSKECPPSKIERRPKLVNPDNFPLPNRSALAVDAYSVPICPDNPTTSMISTIGCIYKCAFCNCKNNRPLQIRSPENVAREMEQIEHLGIRSIMFQDDMFTLNPKRVRKLCEIIIQRGIGLYWTVKSRVDCIRDGMPDLMKEAGCFNIHFGIESGNDKTLARMNKGITVAQARKAVQIVKKAGLSCTGNFMLGYVGEDEEDIQNTINFAIELELDVSQFSISMDAPGTELYAEAVMAGRRSGDAYQEFVLDPENTDISRLFSSDYFDEEALLEFRRQAYARTRTLYDLKGR